MNKILRNFFAFGIACALLSQFVFGAIPVSFAETEVSESSEISEIQEPIDMKKQIVPDSEVPDLIDYSVAVENKYMRRAYEQETSLNDVVFQKTDGSFDVYSFAFPVKYEQSDGTMTDKVPELVRNAELSSGQYRFSTTAQNNVSLQCADIAADGVRYTSEKLTISLRPKTVAEAEFGLQILRASDAEKKVLSDSFTSFLSLSSIESSPVVPETYSSAATKSQAQSAISASAKRVTAARYALSEGNSMTVVPSYNGFQVSLDLSENRTQETFFFELSTNGKTLAKQEGTYVLLNEDGTAAGILGDAILSDENGVVDVVSVGVTQINTGEYLISVPVAVESSATAVTLAATDYYDYIQDTSIYSISSTTTAGSSANLYVGYSSIRGIERILIRPNSWILPAAYTVNSATLYMRDIMGSNVTTTVECRAFTGNEWSESTATWNNVSANSYGNVVSSNVMNSDNGWSKNYVYSFNIKSIVQEWCTNSSAARKGLMLKASSANEAATSTSQQYFASTQYGTEAYRPYMTVNASYTDTVDSGVYYIHSAAGGYLTSTYSSLNGSNVFQKTAKLSTTSNQYLTQLWRVTRLGNGYYTIRPYHYTPAGLTCSQFSTQDKVNADIYNIGYSDDWDYVPSFGMWNIGNMQDGNGLFGTYYSLDFLDSVGFDLVNHHPTTDGGNISIGDNYGGDESKWVFEEVSDVPSEVLFYDSNTGMIETNPNRAIVKLESKRVLAEFGFDVSMSVPGNLNPLSYAWSCSNPGIAEISAATLSVTGLERGTATVRVSYPDDGVQFYAGFTLHVVNGISDGNYFIQNAKSLRYMDIENQVMQNGTTIHQWSFHGGATSRWEVKLQSDGYYTIRSLHSGTTDYYLGVENDSSADGARVVLCSGTITDGMRWSFVRMDTGSYKIIPKCGSSGRILAVEYGSYQEALGLDIKSLTYSDDGYDSDEWFLRNLDDTIEDDLYNMGLIDGDDFVSTDDGFHMIKKSMADILSLAGINQLYTSSDYATTESVQINANRYFCSVTNTATAHYTLLLLEEDGSSTNAGVQIPFVSLNEDTLVNAISSNLNSDIYSLYLDIRRVKLDSGVSFDSALQQYFGDSRSDGPYLVAEEYVKMVASTCSNGYISAPINYITYLSGNETRLSTAIAEMNENSGTTVYDTEMNRILIDDSANLSYYEKCVILATYTGDVTFNSFAAEVVFHSLALKGVLGNIDSMYDSALRADMQTNERYLSGFLGGYHSQYRSLVALQRTYHGEY